MTEYEESLRTTVTTKKRVTQGVRVEKPSQVIPEPEFIHLTLPMPVYLNDMYVYADNRKYLTKEAKEYKAMIHWECKLQKAVQLSGVLGIKIFVFRPRNSGDIDGLLKLLLDSLNLHAYQDDKQVKDLHVIKGKDKDNPRVEVLVYKYGTMSYDDLARVFTAKVNAHE